MIIFIGGKMSNLRKTVEKVANLVVDIVESVTKIKNTVDVYKSETVELEHGDSEKLPPKKSKKK